jgi:urea transport system ATP-binding protein
VSRPRLLLLEEPTEGIQPSIILEIEDAIGELHRSGGMSILLVEQYVEFALRLAQRYAVMENGVITHAGETSAVELASFADLLAV